MNEQVVSRWKTEKTPKNKTLKTNGLKKFQPKGNPEELLKQQEKKIKKEKHLEARQVLNSLVQNATHCNSEWDFLKNETSLPCLCFLEAYELAQNHEPNSLPFIFAWLGVDSQFNKINIPSGAMSLEVAKQLFKARASLWHPDVFKEHPTAALEAMSCLNAAYEGFLKIVR
jgi:hypothetical protein